MPISWRTASIRVASLAKQGKWDVVLKWSRMAAALATQSPLHTILDKHFGQVDFQGRSPQGNLIFLVPGRFQINMKPTGKTTTEVVVLDLRTHHRYRNQISGMSQLDAWFGSLTQSQVDPENDPTDW